MEYRAYFTIPGLTHDQGLALLDALDNTGMGPVMAGPGPGDQPTQIVLTTDGNTAPEATVHMSMAVGWHLGALGLRTLYPSAIEIEPVETGEPVEA